MFLFYIGADATARTSEDKQRYNYLRLVGFQVPLILSDYVLLTHLFCELSVLKMMGLVTINAS